MNILCRSFVRLLMVAAVGTGSGTAWAGRPLVVDDANTNDKGKGHVESWLACAPGTRLYSLAPAYAFGEGLEVAGLLARDSSADLRAHAVHLKWRITPGQQKGCNADLVVGASRTTVAGVSGKASCLNGLVNCNRGDAGSLHLNLGASKPNGASTAGSWGIAYEMAFGPVSPQVEWFGSEGSKPTLQIGLRGNVADNVPLDGASAAATG